MRLAAALIVRDEIDLIEDWVRFHARQGVDCFFVTDHASVDGTFETLLDLTGRFELYVRRREDPLVRQSLWMTEMAVEARDRHGADWVLLSDADEFWLPAAGSLHDVAASAGSPVLECRRYNMLPDRETVEAPGYRFFHNVWRVERPFPEHPPRSDLGEALDWPLFLRALPGKVMCSTAGLSRVGYGNHHVEHSAGAPSAAPLDILHYPVRRFADFERQTARHGYALSQDVAAPNGQSWHQLRLYALWRTGRLRAAYEEMLDEVEVYRSPPDERLVEDRRLSRQLTAAEPVGEPRVSSSYAAT